MPPSTSGRAVGGHQPLDPLDGRVAGGDVDPGPGVGGTAGHARLRSPGMPAGGRPVLRTPCVAIAARRPAGRRLAVGSSRPRSATGTGTG